MDILLEPVTMLYSGTLQALGLEANKAAENAIFSLYQNRRPINTQRSQRAALGIFAEFMRTCGMASPDLYSDPLSWIGITWGLVQTFQAWLLRQGYSIKTINDRVSVVKVYMTLANQAGVVPDGEILRLQSLRGFSRKEAIDLDAKRTKQGIATRCGAKKSQSVLITEDQARALCTIRNETPQARRDALIMCILLDHGLRVSEVSILKIEDIDFNAKQMTFYRPKTGATSRHNIRGRAWQLLAEYMSKDNQAQSGPLILASCKTGALTPGKGMTTRAIQDRVAKLGQGAGLENLSPHDCRHHGANTGRQRPESIAGFAHGVWWMG